MRITDNLLARSVLANSARTLSRFAAYQQMISSGKNLARPSDDPLLLSKILAARSETRRVEAHADNASSAVAFMTLTEDSLQEVSDLLTHAKELVLAGMNGTTDATGADSQVTELRAMIDSLLQIANRDIGGRRLFAGQSTTEAPYSRTGDGVAYRGDARDLLEELGPGLRVALNLTGPGAFETVPAMLEGSVDLNPAVSTITRLADLFDGDGAATGRIRLTDSNGIEAEIDLLGATRLGDVVDAINASGTSVVAAISADRNSITLTDTGGGSTFRVEDVDGGTLARTLGLLGESTSGAIEGLDLDPALTEETPAALLLGGAGLAAGPWTIRTSGETGTRTATIDPSSANTIGDLFDLLENAKDANGASLGIRPRIEGKKLVLESTRLRTTITVSDAASPGSAEALGLAGIGAPRDVFALVEEAARAVSSRDAAAMDRAIRDLTRAIEGTAGVRGGYGARARQVLDLRERLNDESVDLTIRLADLEDVDLAKAALELNQAETVYNAALASGARLYQSNLFDYIR